MSYALYDYMDAGHVNRIRRWTEGLEKEGRVRVNAHFDMLVKNGDNLPAKAVTGTSYGMIKKYRVTDRIRVFFCKGPLNMNEEFTILQGAIESDCELDPRNADSLAHEHRHDIVDCHQRKQQPTKPQKKKKPPCNNERRRLHEHVA